jgi:hypothetical protein
MKKHMMKKFGIALALLLALGTNIYTAQAQVHVSINVGAQPLWGPVGYDYVQYYYMPDIEAYYSVPQRQYIYLDGPRWVFAPALPARYKSYDLYRGYKVVINEPKPYLKHNSYKVKYKKYKGAYGKQAVLKNQPGKGNSKAQAQGNGNGKSKGKGNGKGKQ